jgi:hypothetical protein
MNEANGNNLDFYIWLYDQWDKKRDEESKTMCAKRKLTESEIDRAMVIGKWFIGWTDATGPCPISVTNGHWGKKLCALFEWIAVLETEVNKVNSGHQPLPKGVDCLSLLGVLFRCADGHEWESSVGGVWLQMPWCPECERTKGKRLPAVAWIGEWDAPNKTIRHNGGKGEG